MLIYNFSIARRASFHPNYSQYYPTVNRAETGDVINY